MASYEDLRGVIKKKAEKHKEYYKKLTGYIDNTQTTTDNKQEVALYESKPQYDQKCAFTEEVEVNKRNTFVVNSNLPDVNSVKRCRKIGVCEVKQSKTIIFKSVKSLKDNYLAMLEKTANNLKQSTSKDDFLLLPPTSGYCSSNSDDERDKNCHKNVQRCGSSDSAMGHSDEEAREPWIGKELPYDIPIKSPYSPRGSIDHDNVPSRTLIEAQYVQLPRKCSDSVSDSASRRQSLIDDTEEAIPYRYWRTPSVVVSDYSDDIVGLSLEDVEYIRNQRKDSSPDSSLHSSCSNLNYCGSTISSLDTEYVLRQPFRKSSDCSSCSTLSGDEDGDQSRNKEHKMASSPPTPSGRPKSLMESLLVAKMEQVTLGHPKLVRTDSADSASSLGSVTSVTSDVCRCDDCLLGIADYYAQADHAGEKKKKPSGWRKLRNIVQWTPFFQTYKKQRYPWVQLAGHQGNFKAGPDQGTILKKLCVKEEKCFKVLMNDVLRPYVPEYKGLVASDDGECSYIQLQDLLGDFISPCVMDCKIGVRTYLEEELAKAKEKPKLRKDMYEKMCQIDTNAPTDEEHKLKGVTKPRYMVWRETISSTATLGFRIEGIRKHDGSSSKDFKTTKTKNQIVKAFIDFTEGFPHAVPKYIQRLKAIKATLESSQFFTSHEVIGSSLLFVHDRYNANVWLIDFAKTIKLPEDIRINHNSGWKVGNHEDGYLIGVNNLISIFMALLENQPITVSPPLSLQDPPEVDENDLQVPHLM